MSIIIEVFCSICMPLIEVGIIVRDHHFHIYFEWIFFAKFYIDIHGSLFEHSVTFLNSALKLTLIVYTILFICRCFVSESEALGTTTLCVLYKVCHFKLHCGFDTNFYIFVHRWLTEAGNVLLHRNSIDWPNNTIPSAIYMSNKMLIMILKITSNSQFDIIKSYVQ